MATTAPITDHLTIPLDKAVLCATCNCITTSKGESCDYCGAKTLMSMARVLDRN